MVDARERLINLETAKALGFAAVAESVLITPAPPARPWHAVLAFVVIRRRSHPNIQYWADCRKGKGGKSAGTLLSLTACIDRSSAGGFWPIRSQRPSLSWPPWLSTRTSWKPSSTARIGDGDVLMVTRLDRLARSRLSSPPVNTLMDSHENARLTPKGREQMVRAVVDSGMTRAAAALARRYASVLALTEDSQITKMVRVCGHEDAGMHLAVS